MSTLQDLKKSFTQLKQSARSDRDLFIWLKDNAAFLPHVTEAFVPYLVVTPSGLTCLAREDNGISKRVAIEYFARLPSMTPAEFSALVGCTVITHDDEQQAPEIRGNLELVLPMREWPYVLAELTHGFLTGANRTWRNQQPVVKELWDKEHPTLPWSMLEQFAAADLLPQEARDFTAWAYGSRNYNNPVTIPENFSY